MKAVKFPLFFILVFFVSGVKSAACQTKIIRSGDWAIARVRALPEVKAFLLETPKSNKPTVMLAGEAGSTAKYYWVKVGISNFDMFRTTYDFYVDPKTAKIYYWDQLCDDAPMYLISLQQWRYWRKIPGWQKLHSYKHGKLVVLAK